MYRPGLHCSWHAVLFGAEYWPSGHELHACPSLYEAPGHISLHSLSPASDRRFSGHASQEVAPCVATNFPGSHLSQSVATGAALKVPSRQFTQLLAHVSAKVPASQMSHSMLFPVFGLNFPVGQHSQDPDCSLLTDPGGQSSTQSIFDGLEYRFCPPTLHNLHSVLASTLTLPGLHSSHSDLRERN